jgi:hypothetical protein
MNPEPWIEARKRHHLSHAHVQMARELGMNPRKLGKIDNHKQQQWKAPLPQYIEYLYEKRFGRTRPAIVMSVEERARAQKEKKAARKAEKLQPERDDEGREPEELSAAWEEAVDARPEVSRLFSNLKHSLPALKKLLDESTSHWGYEDPIYRLYHQSVKVYGLQDRTMSIVAALQALAPERRLNPWFTQIVSEGTGRQFEAEDNRYWLEITRPMVEAFFHARFFLEMAVRYGKSLEQPPQLLPSGWAAFLYLFELR